MDDVRSEHRRQLQAGRMTVLATLLEIHQAWAWVVIIGNGLAGVWVLAAGRYRALRTRALWCFVICVEVAILVQVLLGLALVTAEGLVAPFFHYFYGIVATVVVTAMFLYRRRMGRRIYLLY